jgi:hypothetical protein
MRKNFYIILIFLFINPVLAEKVPAGYVAKWNTLPLINDDYEIKYDQDCVSFEGILKRGKMEQPHITPFKIVNETFSNFINGYLSKVPNENLKEYLGVDTVVIWPNYEQSDWYVLLGKNSCFVKWLEIQPDNIDAIIALGEKI